jgi:hypothetical protein
MGILYGLGSRSFRASLFHRHHRLSNLFRCNFPQIARAATKVSSAPSQIVDIGVIDNRQ